MSFRGLQNFSCVSVYLASSYCLLTVQNTNLLRKIMSEPMQFLFFFFLQLLFYINIIFLSTTYIWTCLKYTSLYSSRNKLCKIGGSYVAFGLGQFRVSCKSLSHSESFLLVCNHCPVCTLCILVHLYKKRSLIVGLFCFHVCDFQCFRNQVDKSF